MGDDVEKITTFTDAIHDFGEYEYYTIEDRIVEALAEYGISVDAAYSPLMRLSGGQKRFVELVRVRFSQADLVLLDEPTNHMDYWGKERFLRWLRTTKQAIFVISHDRDVLKEVTKITEIKDRSLQSFPGNYDAYLKQNKNATVTQVSQYEESLKKLEILRKQIQAAVARKAGAGDSAPKILEMRLRREYNEIAENLEKPSFWIDQDSVDQLDEKVADSYHKYKDRSIRIAHEGVEDYRYRLLEAKQLAVGYDQPLFHDAHFVLQHGDRLFIKGRNGAGKSTLLRTIISTVAGVDATTTIFHGSIEASPKLRLGVYEQELDGRYLGMTLAAAIRDVYAERRISITEEQLAKLLAGYLFNPSEDKHLLIEQLSGGQKARFQIIKMLCNKPNVLILDEPTNHLDLPSIEELEKSLATYDGAVIYVSHDSYFLQKMGGNVLQIGGE
jgi:ATPase subunit of ABC transporter with duplicated ATPase domains